jgi:hypothetical protein
MSSDPLQLRAGDLTAAHIGWRIKCSGTIAKIEHSESKTHIVSYEGVTQFVDNIEPSDVLYISPPAPIRRRITWANLQDVPPRQWDGIKVSVVSEGSIDWDSANMLDTTRDLYLWHSWLRNDSDRAVVIEVPQGHALSECGEAVT